MTCECTAWHSASRRVVTLVRWGPHDLGERHSAQRNAWGARPSTVTGDIVISVIVSTSYHVHPPIIPPHATAAIPVLRAWLRRIPYPKPVSRRPQLLQVIEKDGTQPINTSTRTGCGINVRHPIRGYSYTQPFRSNQGRNWKASPINKIK